MRSPKSFSAFLDGVRIASGSMPAVTASLRAGGLDPRLALLFDDETGDSVQLKSETEIEGALTSVPAAPVAVEVRVLPRHREWLETQPGGASAAIRRLIEAARRDPAEQVRQAKTAAYRFISMLAGDFEGYEEACRALFAGDAEHFAVATAAWPGDIRLYGLDLARPAFRHA